MTCQDFETLVALEVAGDLSGRESAEVRAHLEHCESCRLLAEDLAADLEWLQAAHREQPDRAALHQVRVGVMRRLESEQSRWNRPFGGLAARGGRWQWVVTAAAAVILMGSAVWWSGSVEQRTPTAALNPADDGGPQARSTTSATEQSVEPGGVPAGTLTEAGTGTSETAASRHMERAREAEVTASRESDSEPTPKTNRDLEPPRETAPAPQLARLEPAVSEPTALADPIDEPLGSKAKVEIVTALLDGPQETPRETPQETVMLKIPTANPDIVVYWLMDEEERPQGDEENEGD